VMKSLIVNGDDFGASHGVNRGVIEAHVRGILTSTSMMVYRPASAAAARLGAQHPGLGVGLHVELDSVSDSRPPEAEIESQLERFVELCGQRPTHIDAHHNVNREASLHRAFVAVAERHKLPLRGYCGVRHIAKFFGQWDGESHPEQVGPSALADILDAELEEGFNELCCHPGYVDGDLESSYAVERETELATLCDPEVAALLSERGIRLVTFREVSQP
jgi:chitin disaccharide deacetylase